MSDQELAEVLSGKSIGFLWGLAQEIMAEAAPTGEIDAGHLHLVDACLAELGHRYPEVYDTPEIDEFRALVASKLDALPSCGHA